MKIQRLSLFQGSLDARGLAVVVDVFRAFTCEPLLYHYGVQRIILEADIGRAKAFQGEYIRIGEHNEVPIEGFDLTNSPLFIMERGKDFFSGKSVIHRTTSGVAGAVNALDNTDEVMLASFVNSRATAEYIRRRNPALVCIVAMGIRSMVKAPEDECCGDYIQSLLTDGRYDHTAAISTILRHETAQKFLRGDKTYLPKEDPLICLQRDLFDFALKAEMRDGMVEAVRVDTVP